MSIKPFIVKLIQWERPNSNWERKGNVAFVIELGFCKSLKIRGSSGRTRTYNPPVNSRIPPFLLLFAASCLVVIRCDHFRSSRALPRIRDCYSDVSS
jgi:hypothetical protein